MSRLPRAGCRLWHSFALGAVLLFISYSVTPVGAAPPPQDAQKAPVTLVADHIEYDTETGIVTADGHVEISRGEDVIKADHLVGNLKTEEIEATGHVTLVRGSQTATAESLRYNFLARMARVEEVVTRYGAWHVKSQSMETSVGQGVAFGASVTPCDPQHPIFHLTARKVVVVPGDYLTAYDAALYIYGVHIVTLPSYTVSLDPRRRGARSGPSFGYTSLDGPYAEYNQFFLLGSASDQLRLRYGTLTNFTVEDTLSQQDADHLWSLHLGRLETFDVNGNFINLDAYSLDLTYDSHRIAGWPLTYQVEGHYGRYNELLTGVSTTRADGLFNLATDSFQLSPSVSAAASGSFQFDTYGTGQQRTLERVAGAMTATLGPIDSVTLSYEATNVIGSTPFSFDSLSPDSAVTLSYNNYPGVGLLQSWGVSGTYDYYSQQTSLGAYVALALSPTLQMNVSASYNAATQQFTEVDYAVNVQCDCVAVGLLYRMFPQTPALNTFLFTVGLSPFVTTSTNPVF